MAVMGERANGRLKKNRRDALGFLCSRRWCSPSKRRLSQPATDRSHCSKVLAWSALYPQKSVWPCYHLRSRRPWWQENKAFLRKWPGGSLFWPSTSFCGLNLVSFQPTTLFSGLLTYTCLVSLRGLLVSSAVYRYSPS